MLDCERVLMFVFMFMFIGHGEVYVSVYVCVDRDVAEAEVAAAAMEEVFMFFVRNERSAIAAAELVDIMTGPFSIYLLC